MNCYADLTTLKSDSYLKIPSTSTADDSYLLSLLIAASRAIDNWTKRFFYVWEGTKYYNGAAYILFTDDLLSVTTFKADGDTDGTYEESWTADTDYQLFPLNEYPKLRAEISNRTTRLYSDFNYGVKKGIQIIGTFGYAETATPYKTSGTTVNTGNIAIDATTHALATGMGSLFAVGQTIKIGSEQLFISSISTDTLTFLFNPLRGQNGTTAAAHTSGDVIYIYQYPGLIRLATLIQAMRWWKRKDSAFQDVVGSPETGQLNYYKKLDPDISNIIGMYINARGG